MLLFFILKTVLIFSGTQPFQPLFLSFSSLQYHSRPNVDLNLKEKSSTYIGPPSLPSFYISVREVVKTYLCAATQIMFLGGDFEFVLCFDKFEDYSSQRLDGDRVSVEPRTVFGRIPRRYKY